MEFEISQKEKEKNQEKYDSALAIQFDEDDIKDVIKTLRSLCTYIETEKNKKSAMYKAYMAKFNEGFTLLKMTEPNNPMTELFNSKTIEWEEARKGFLRNCLENSLFYFRCSVKS